MLKDIHFEFTGFHGSRGRCQIRLARHGNNKPLVVVCSQYRNYSGTSITNAHEIIAADLLCKLANREIADVVLDGPLPVFREWHDDANLLDKALVRLFPSKYGERFESVRLNVPSVFSNIVWLENYPAQPDRHTITNRCHLVTRGDDGCPVWHGRPPDDWLMRKTGFKLAELLPADEALDLHIFEKATHDVVTSSVEVQSLPGYNSIRWTVEMLELLPSLLDAARARCRRRTIADLEESVIQYELEQFFAVQLPARELFDREYPFSKELGIHERGREKAVDFVLRTPLGRGIHAIIEVKRTSSRSSRLFSAVKNAPARRVLRSDHYACDCDIVVCGDQTIIADELGQMPDLLSLDDDDTKRDRRFELTPADFAAEYHTLLNGRTLTASSRLQGKRDHGTNQVVLWQVTGCRRELHTHRPYTFVLSEAPNA